MSADPVQLLDRLAPPEGWSEPTDLDTDPVAAAILERVFADVPSCDTPRSQLSSDGHPVVDAFVDSGLCKSKGEARRTIKEGGAYVNDARISDQEATLTEKDLATESLIVLRRGKRKYALVRLT